MNPVFNVWDTYRRRGFHAAAALTEYYVAKARALVAGPGRHCPICGWRGREFHPIAYVASGTWRTKASCPRCGSLERHRALFFVYHDYFRSHPRPVRILHFAPERCFRHLFQSHSSRYITSNYGQEPSDLRLDLEHLGLSDESFDLLVANGVLTSVANYDRAIESLYRVLKSGGAGLLCDIVDPHENARELPERPMDQRRALGGRDLAERFWPFEAEVLDATSFVPHLDHERFGIRRDDFYLIRLRKPGNGERSAGGS